MYSVAYLELLSGKHFQQQDAVYCKLKFIFFNNSKFGISLNLACDVKKPTAALVFGFSWSFSISHIFKIVSALLLFYKTKL